MEDITHLQNLDNLRFHTFLIHHTYKIQCKELLYERMGFLLKFQNIQDELLHKDYNLNKVAKIHGVNVLNINELFLSLCPPYVLGDKITIKVIKQGNAPGQGVGSLEDGTMVVIDGAAELIGEVIVGEVRQVFQRPTGNMIFGVLKHIKQ